MTEANATFFVRRHGPAGVVDIKGDVTAGSETVLMAAYDEIGDARAVVLNFSDLSYMNSGGIGLLVTLLVRAQRHSQQLLAYGLSDHYRQIFELTRLDEAIGIHDDEPAALGAVGPRRRLMSRRATSGLPPATRPTGPRRSRELKVSEVPAGATGINVAGKRLASPIQGFGKMWQKTYQVRVPAGRASAVDLIAMWKQRFPDFWPEGNHFYGPITGIAPGEVALIEGVLPGRLKLSTGVMVLYADEESFTLMTPQGHMFAGWITFSASDQSDETLAQAQVLMRASDPIFELGLMLGGHARRTGSGTPPCGTWRRPTTSPTARSTPLWSAWTRTGSGSDGPTSGTRRRSGPRSTR